MSRSAVDRPLRCDSPDMDFRSLNTGAGPIVWFSNDMREAYQFTQCKLFPSSPRLRHGGTARVYWSRMSDARGFLFEVHISDEDYGKTPAWALVGAALFHTWYLHVTEDMGDEVYSHA